MAFRDAPYLARPVLAFDTETELFGPGNMIPLMVSAAFAGKREGPAKLLLWSSSEHVIADMLSRAARGELVIVGQKIGYDMAVSARRFPRLLPLIFEAYDADGIVDTEIAFKFLDNFHGRLKDDKRRVSYSLAAAAKRFWGVEISKGDDTWRKRYGELIHTPIADWPEAARRYAEDDPIWTLRIWLHIVEECRRLEREHALGYAILGNIPAQARASFAAVLSTAWGVHSDPIRVADLETAAATQAARANAKLKATGLLKVKKDAHLQVNPKTGLPIKDQKALQTKIGAVLAAHPEITNYCQTPDKLWSAAAEDLERLKGLDPGIDAYLELAEVQKTLTTWIPMLRQGVTVPIHASVDIMKTTGRLSYFDPNLQQMPRKDGVRQCFIPRRGKLFCSIDYDGAELRAWAQVCLWMGIKTPMATMFQNDPDADAHSMLAANMLGMSYAEVLKLKKTVERVKDARQAAKPGNFGFLANMGIPTFIESNRCADPPMIFTEAEAWALKRAFIRTWDAKKYFDAISRRMGYDDTVRMLTPRSFRYRGQCTYTRLANGYFQSPVADGAKEAFYEVVKRQYTDRFWPGYGSRIVIFVHDESFSELDAEGAHEQAMAIRDVQVACLQKWLPDIPVTAAPALMHRWEKKADPVYNEAGRLIPWVPKESSPGQAKG